MTLPVGRDLGRRYSVQGVRRKKHNITRDTHAVWKKGEGFSEATERAEPLFAFDSHPVELEEQSSGVWYSRLPLLWGVFFLRAQKTAKNFTYILSKNVVVWGEGVDGEGQIKAFATKMNAQNTHTQKNWVISHQGYDPNKRL